MTDREKVIKGLECIVSSGNAGMRDDCANCIFPGGGDCLAPALRNAFALLKAQEAMEPTWKNGYPLCGECGFKLHWIIEQNNYCPNCGRAVKWE